MRKFFVGGNWKCNGTVESVKKLVGDLNDSIEKIPGEDVVDVVVAPQTLHIPYVAANIKPRYTVSAQNCYIKAGAFTGELSAPAAADFGLKWTLLGHSERRHIFGESDKLLTDKTTAALENGLNIIFCIGELLAEREANKTKDVIATQMAALAAGIKKPEDWARIVIAYEPVWAIGTGKTATPDQAQEAHVWTRDWLREHVSAAVADSIRVIYGGSVTPATADELAAKPDVDGFLVGGASLSAEKFVPIINAAKAKKH